MSDAWRLDAAVRSSFVPGALPEPPGDAALREFARKRHDGMWILPDSTRREVLAEAGLERVREALERVPMTEDVDDLGLRVLRRVVRDDGAALDDWTLEELRVGQAVVRWLSGLTELTRLPTQERVGSRYERESLLAPLRQAVHGFQGRTAQLAALRQHAFAGETTTMVVTGVGGSGKTALLSKLVVELADSGMKVAYLDLDRADLDLRRMQVAVGLESVVQDHRPGMLAAEIARQVAALADEPSGSWMRALDNSRAAWMRGAPFTEALHQMRKRLGGGPLVVVLDTFEEAQYERMSGAVEAVRRLIAELKKAWPATRVIIGGRALVPELDSSNMPLDDLDTPAAIRLLQATASPTVLLEPDAERIVDHIGSNPLWLLVAARAIAHDPQVVRDIGPLRDRAAAAFLYLRVLDHVHDVPHSELIEASLHLRALSPELLCDVVAPEVGVHLELDEARAHLTALAREVALVTPGDPFMRHREEVRALTLVGLRDRDPARWRRMHFAAHSWWSKHAEGPADAAEAIYHALAVWDGESPLQWAPDYARYLGDALLESTLPLASRTFLLNHNVGPAADALPPHEQALASARRAFESGDWPMVVRTLSNRKVDAAAMLLLARALRKLGRPEARAQALQARILAGEDLVTAHDAVLDEAAWLAEDGDGDGAIGVLDEALTSTRAPIRRLQLLDARHTLRPTKSDQNRAQNEIRQVGAANVAADPQLLRNLLRWVPDDELLVLGLDRFGLHDLATHDLEVLSEAVGAWQANRKIVRGPPRTVETAALASFLEHAFSQNDLLRFVSRRYPEIEAGLPSTAGSTREVAQAVTQDLQRHAFVDDELRRALRDVLPRLTDEIDALWHVDVFRGIPGEFIRTVDRLYARDRKLPGSVAAALRHILTSAPTTSDISLMELIRELAVALPDERRRFFAATSIGLPNPGNAARHTAALVAAAEAGGALDRLVQEVRRSEPAFGESIADAWLGVLSIRLEAAAHAGARSTVVRIVDSVRSYEYCIHIDRMFDILGATGHLEELRVLLDGLPEGEVSARIVGHPFSGRTRALERLDPWTLLARMETSITTALEAGQPTDERVAMRGLIALRLFRTGSVDPDRLFELATLGAQGRDRLSKLLRAALHQVSSPANPRPWRASDFSEQADDLRFAVAFGFIDEALRHLDRFLEFYPWATDRILLLEDLIELHGLTDDSFACELLERLRRSIDEARARPPEV